MRIGILTVSDLGALGQRADTSGDAIVEWAASHGYEVAVRSVVPDETDRIAGKLARWADSGEVDVVLTTGGTGLTARDVTPEATEAVLDRLAPGIADALRSAAAAGFPRLAVARRGWHAGQDADRQPPRLDGGCEGWAGRARGLARPRRRPGDRGSNRARRTAHRSRCLTASSSPRTIWSTPSASTRRSRRRGSTPPWRTRSTRRGRP